MDSYETCFSKKLVRKERITLLEEKQVITLYETVVEKLALKLKSWN